MVSPGALFYNFDFKTIEFFDGNSWKQVDNTTRNIRAVFSSGATSDGDLIHSINISSEGNSIDFDLQTGKSELNGMKRGTRGIFANGY